MRKYYPPLLTLTLALLVVSACVKTPPVIETPVVVTQDATIESQVDTTPEATPIPAPGADFSRVCGTVTYSDGAPFDLDTIYLAPVYEGTAIVLDTSSSPGAKTGEDGHFCTAEIKPGEYVLVIGSPEEAYEIYSLDGTKAVVYEAQSGVTLEIGTVETNLLP